MNIKYVAHLQAVACLVELNPFTGKMGKSLFVRNETFIKRNYTNKVEDTGASCAVTNKIMNLI